ncbi:MAG: glycosyltransferase [Segetibacter sp.]|nr:glycosyltransferase [Segetibacter sp.]
MDFRTRDINNQPLVSIGVLSYNYAAYVLQTLNSIFLQTYPHIELFIVDDYSTDNSVELISDWIAEKNVDCTFITHPKNLGRNTAINTIIEKSSGKYLALFASDDVMNPRRIEEQVKALQQATEDYVVSYSDAELINEEGVERGLYSQKNMCPFLDGNVFPEFYYGRFFMAAPTLLFRRNVFDKVGTYDSRLWAEDYDMWMRILPWHKVKYCKYVGVKYRVKDVVSTNVSYQRELKELYHKDRIIIYHRLITALKDTEKFADIRKAAIKKINYHLLNLKELNSPYFLKMFKFLCARSFFDISYLHLLKMQVKKFFQFQKAKESFS